MNTRTLISAKILLKLHQKDELRVIMILSWNPYWYDLDQTIVVGDIDYFYLEANKQAFANGFVSSKDKEVKAIILRINHKTLGSIRGVLTRGLDYHFYLQDGQVIKVDAEEEPGKAYEQDILINDWCVEVEIQILEETGLSSELRMNSINKTDMKQILKDREGKYKQILGIDSLPAT